VFEYGFKVPPHHDYPFLLWLACGLIPWFFIAEALNTGCHAIKDNGFLVKKIVFNVSLLPLVKIASALAVHLLFICILLGLFFSYGYSASVHWLQLGYYLICLTGLLIALAWLTSAIVIFFPDLSQIIAMVTQLGFWLTPVFWDITAFPSTVTQYLYLNPFTYIVEGFRDSMVRGVWFWEHPIQTMLFWGGLIFLTLISRYTFKKLRPHFSDVM
jgi:lipopolysaccharide transport system permease protein/teichoic acid transport system permease protein